MRLPCVCFNCGRLTHETWFCNQQKSSTSNLCGKWLKGEDKSWFIPEWSENLPEFSVLPESDYRDTIDEEHLPNPTDVPVRTSMDIAFDLVNVDNGRILEVTNSKADVVCLEQGNLNKTERFTLVPNIDFNGHIIESQNAHLPTDGEYDPVSTLLTNHNLSSDREGFKDNRSAFEIVFPGTEVVKNIGAPITKADLSRDENTGKGKEIINNQNYVDSLKVLNRNWKKRIRSIYDPSSRKRRGAIRLTTHNSETDECNLLDESLFINMAVNESRLSFDPRSAEVAGKPCREQ